MNILNRQPIALLGFESELVHPCDRLTQGRSASVLQMAQALSKLGWHVDVFTCKQLGEPDLKQPRIVEHLRSCRTVYLPAAADRLSDFVRAFQTFQTKQGLSYPIVHTQDENAYWAGLQLKQSSAVQWVHTVWMDRSRLNPIDGKQELKPVHGKPSQQMEPKIDPQNFYPKADQIVELILGEPPRIARQLLSDGTTYRSAQLSQSEAKRKFGLSPLDPVGLYLGSLHPLKGLDVLIKALALHRDRIVHHAPGTTVHPLKLLIVYDQLDVQSQQQIQQQLEELGIASSVTWVERVPAQEWLYYTAADVRIIPSLYEPFGTEVLTTLDYGLPVIASSVGGLQFTVVHGETGLLVPPDKPAALAEAIDQIVLDDLGFKRLRRQAIDLTVSGWYRTAAHLSDLYRRLLAGAISELIPKQTAPYTLAVPVVQPWDVLSATQRTGELVQVS